MWSQATRYGGAVGVVAIGLDHLDQLIAQGYSVIPTIGSLFVLNVVAAGVVAAALVVPLPSRHERAARIGVLGAAAAGIALAAGSLGGLVLSETTGLFSFRESGVRPAIELAAALDVATIALLTAYLVATLASGRAPAPHAPRERRSPDPRSQPAVDGTTAGSGGPLTARRPRAK